MNSFSVFNTHIAAIFSLVVLSNYNFLILKSIQIYFVIHILCNTYIYIYICITEKYLLLSMFNAGLKLCKGQWSRMAANWDPKLGKSLCAKLSAWIVKQVNDDYTRSYPLSFCRTELTDSQKYKERWII